MTSRRRLLAASAAAVPLSLGAPLVARAQPGFPTRPVRVLVPFAPGGATDLVARPLAHRLAELWGQPVLVDNRPGAAGNIALEAAMRALPDGYTLFIGNVTTNAISETLYPQVFSKLRPSRDLVGITSLVEIPHVLVGHPSVPASDAKEFVAFARKNPNKLNYASSGIGSYPHLDMIMFERATGMQMTHIPYKGGAGQMVPALLGNESQIAFLNLASTIEHIRTGRLRAFATTAPQRLPELPGTPTMAEQGFAGIGTNAWNGLFAPAALARPLLERMHAQTVKIMNAPELRDLLGKILMQVITSKSPDDFSAFVRAETAKWARVVKENDIRIDV